MFKSNMEIVEVVIAFVRILIYFFIHVELKHAKVGHETVAKV